jgi:hypothetical protein
MTDGWYYLDRIVENAKELKEEFGEAYQRLKTLSLLLAGLKGKGLDEMERERGVMPLAVEKKANTLLRDLTLIVEELEEDLAENISLVDAFLNTALELDYILR